jgi:hypothetical protein
MVDTRSWSGGVIIGRLFNQARMHTQRRGRLKKNLAKCFSLVHEFSYPVNKPKEEGSVIEEGSVMEEGLVSST